jgi:oligopeptide transport system substrate-binding protein
MMPSSRVFASLPLIYLLLASLAGLLGCRSIAASAPRELRLNLGMEPATLDPALATDPGSQQIARLIFPGLVDTDPVTGAPRHALASAWAVSSDGLVWEFKLREDAVWVRYNPVTDKIDPRRPVTAEDVIYSVRRIFDPRVGSGFAPLFAPLIRGARELLRADPDPEKTSDEEFARLFSGLGVQQMDEMTVRFTLTSPVSFFPSIVSLWLGRLEARESVEAGGPVWTEPGSLWTSGPYVLERWSHGRSISLQKNPYWYDASTVRIQRVRFTMIGDPATALEEYRAGNLDSLDPYGGLTADDVESMKEDPILSTQLHILPTLCTHYYGFDTSKPPFDNLHLRKAFAAAIDRETLVTSVVRMGEPARWFTRPGVYASIDISDTIGIPFDANLARDELRQAGLDPKRMPNISLTVNTNDMHMRIAETIAQMWKNNLGIEVHVTELDWKKYTQTLKDAPPQIFRLGWCAYVPDAGNFLGVFRSGSGENYTRWSSLGVDQAVDAAARETEIDRRRTLYRSVEKALIEDYVAIVPLWWSTRATLTQPNVQRTYAITDGYERIETWTVQ